MPNKNTNTNSGRGKKNGRHEAFGLVLILISAFFLLCLTFPMVLSSIGAWIKMALTGCFGACAYVLFIVTMTWGIFAFRGSKLAVSKKRAAYIVLLCVFGLFILQLATTHKFLKSENLSAYLKPVFDYAENFSVGGALFGTIVYGIKSIISTPGAYIFFGFVFALFTLLLTMDIMASNRPLKENKRNYRANGKERGGQSRVTFIKSGAESAQVKPVVNNGLFVGDIIPREKRVSSDSGSFSEIEKESGRHEKPQKKLSDFFESVKTQRDEPAGEKERVNAKKVLFEDYEKLQEESAARFISSLNNQRDLSRDELGRSDKTPRAVSSAPDIKDDKKEESPLKKADKKNLEVVFPPYKEAPKYVPGEIINGEKISSTIKSKDTAKFRSPEPDRFYYDDQYNFQDKDAAAREFLNKPKAQSAPYIPDEKQAAPDDFSKDYKEATVDFAAPGEIINADMYEPTQSKPAPESRSESQNKGYFSVSESESLSKKEPEYEVVNEDSGTYRLYAPKHEVYFEEQIEFGTPVKEPIFEMPVSAHSFFDNENHDGALPETVQDFTQSKATQNKSEQPEKAFDYSPRPEPVFEDYGLREDYSANEERDFEKDFFGDNADDNYDKTETLSDNDLEDSDIKDDPLDFANPYGEEKQPDLSFVKRINQYEETLRKGEKQPAAPKEKPIAAPMAEEKPAPSYELKTVNFDSELKSVEKAQPEPDYTGYYLKKEEPVPERIVPFTERTAALNKKIDPKNQINMDSYLSASAAVADEPAKPKRKKTSRYVAPPSDLLTCESTNPDDYGADYEANITLLEETLRNLKLPAKVKNITRGPAVTRYELEMPPGTTVKRIEGFSQDIAYALASSGGIRIEAPIPGKRAVGVEVPNSSIGIVGLRDLIESPEFSKNPSHMAICIGKDIAGKNVVAPLEKMPHLLVAGSTGSGKSACLHSIIISILYKSSPADVRLILIDPKRVEFPFYKNLPHLLINQIVNEREHAINAFKWVKDEMTSRYKQLAKIGARNQQDYNMSATVRSGEEEKLPSIVIVVDELSDLMSGGLKKEMEELVLSIAQLGRAAGIHLILATQRPSVDVITGTIKVNFPSRIALAVSNAVDSKTILDQSGAEMLLGRGDLLYAPIDAPDPKRIQGAYVTGDEVEDIVKFIYENNPAEYYDDVEGIIMREKEQDEDDSADAEDQGDEAFDPLLEEVARKVIETGQASTSMMQRRFKLGYARASRIIDQLERYGFIGPMDVNRPTKPREVFITRDSFKDFFGRDY